MLYEFKLGHKPVKATKNIHYAEVEGAVYHSTVTRLLKKFHLSCKKLNHQARLGRPKSMAFYGCAPTHRCCWSVGFYGISTFVGYLTPNLLLHK